MKRNAHLMMLLTVGLMAGCVERRFTVNSDPPGALVYHNGIYLGATPVDGYIIYYGKQQLRLIKEGYDTLDVVQEYPPPFYELPGIDFFSENIYPLKIRDVRRFCYTMTPQKTTRPEDVRDQAEQLRRRGQTIGVPLPPRPILLPPSTSPSTPPPGVAPPGPPADLPPPRTLPPAGVPAGPPSPPPPPPPPIAPGGTLPGPPPPGVSAP
jgi:hypothetical protein